MGANGKGSRRRPMQVPRTEFVKHWEMAFAKNNKGAERKIREERSITRSLQWMNAQIFRFWDKAHA